MSDEMPRFNWGEPDEFGTRPPPEKYLKPGPLPVGEVNVATLRQLINETFQSTIYWVTGDFEKLEESDTEAVTLEKIQKNITAMNNAMFKRDREQQPKLDRLAKYDNFLDAAGSILAELNNREW